MGIPYLCWSVIYFLCTLPVSHYPSTTVAFRGLASIVETGYYQLYFLLVIMQFYLVFPLVLVLLRRTRGHHGLVIVVTLLAQVAIAIGMHWNLFPREMVRFGQQDALSYLLYLVGGCVVAFHFDQVHVWVCAHARLVVALTAAAALAAEGIYFLAAHGVITVLGSGSDPFQPSVIPFNVGAVTCGYLAGVALVRPGRSRRVKAVVCLATVAIVFPAGIALTSVLARTPLAVPLTGRTQVPWRRPRRFPPHPVVLGDQGGVDAVEPLTQGVAGSWHT